MIKNSIRIISGQYKNTKVTFPTMQELRPTPSKVKGILFNWINNHWNNNFTDKNVLDLFAGSGSLGFEAASRGANFIQMVDNDKETIQFIKKNIKKINAKNINFYYGDAIDFICKKNTKKFDLILLDPPFNQNILKKLWMFIPKTIKKYGLIYSESELDITTPENYKLLKSSRNGIVYSKLMICEYKL
ncbi:N6-adenine-specific methyltransferase [Candidatus Kinetoplastibacterium blastocrithidii TCC012E]|uniref:N6-adenine-specific methyltransferase n=1 Tax=Candidatus Kinetoplastidibacterium blastocrithidiae TCC012E TaxID=1208922 RepID=M1LVW8_9PROT|nr:16S rRNA (guanine(966)-N(2))-methyltransferase RsmD [Candidatus Kinetoplastibacterium blastocrithidii]AFZ83584.1 N6-adenine-specific methyltransferase [Candidatus Kinetoplastibacterium blastocrithidii (ex Strigomonas culicis)]AGF49702.1 N6-adenine-specific methyltransferase [Candidatus Kinetoplastibacterium blastocrithidii TCC012E]